MLRDRRMPLALLCIGILGIGWCITDRYRVRASFFQTGKLTERSDVDWSPEERPAWHRVDPPRYLEPYGPLAQEVAGEGSTRARAERLLRYVAELGGDVDTANDQANPLIKTDNVAQIIDSVQSKEFRGNCAHYSAILHTLSLSAGLDARFVAVEAYQWLNGVGHALNEIYLPETGSWMAVDPLFHAIFVDASGAPLSVLDLREYLLDGRESEVRVVQGNVRARADSPAEVLGMYKIHIPRVMYPGGNNILEEQAEIYGSWFARLVRLDLWPRPLRRVMENTFWTLDRRYIYVDRPELDDRFIPYYVYRLSWLLVATSGVWLLSGWLAGSRRAPHDPA